MVERRPEANAAETQLADVPARPFNHVPAASPSRRRNTFITCCATGQ